MKISPIDHCRGPYIRAQNRLAEYANNKDTVATLVALDMWRKLFVELDHTLSIQLSFRAKSQLETHRIPKK